MEENGEYLKQLLSFISEEVSVHFGRGRTARYIPALAEVDPRKFAISVVTVNGHEAAFGAATEPFSIQSIGKLFTLILALRVHGTELWTRVGKEPSGTRFDSLVQLDFEEGAPRNPFINSGALVVVDSLMSIRKGKTACLVRDYARVLSQNFSIDFDEEVAASERQVAYRNAAIVHLLKSHGTIENDPTELLNVYCRICSLKMSCTDLARAFLALANRGVSPILHEAVVTERQARRINAVMMTCGMYDSVGNFAYRVGLPAKSGVGGGIIAIAPNYGSIAVWSPELDRSGNSLVGTAALELFTQLTRLSVF